MIQTKAELKRCLEWDAKANKIPNHSMRFWIKSLISPNYIWIYICCLRKAEFYKNSSASFLYKLIYVLLKIRLNRLSVKLGMAIPPNVFGPGLSIPHYGGIVVNENAKVGNNCRLMHGVTIGTTSGSNKAPNIGNNVFLGTGSIVLGDIEITDDISVAANAVVTKSCTEKGAMLAGVPAMIKKNSCPVWWEYNRLSL